MRKLDEIKEPVNLTLAERVAIMEKIVHIHEQKLIHVQNMAKAGRDSARGHFCDASKQCDAIVNHLTEARRVLADIKASAYTPDHWQPKPSVAEKERLDPAPRPSGLDGLCALCPSNMQNPAKGPIHLIFPQGGPPMEHQLKTDIAQFNAKLSGIKPWELRRDDRGFKEGDTLVLRETVFTGEQMLNEGLPLEYTGRELKERVTYVLRGPIYGLPEGHCIMTTEPYNVCLPLFLIRLRQSTVSLLKYIAIISVGYIIAMEIYFKLCK